MRERLRFFNLAAVLKSSFLCSSLQSCFGAFVSVCRSSFVPRSTTEWMMAMMQTSDNTAQLKQPLYVTVGPPCAGKTTVLKTISGKLSIPLQDVTLDGQRDVYVQVPTQYFLEDNHHERGALARCIQHKSIHSRICDKTTNGELRLLLRYFSDILNTTDLQSSMHSLYRDIFHAAHPEDLRTRSDYTKMAGDVVTVAQDVRNARNNTNMTLPDTIQLFCVESLFRAHPETNWTGIEAGSSQLQQVSRQNLTTSSVAWGNTNTRPREYRVALEAAEDGGRPVYFILFADSNLTSTGVYMPKIDTKELMRRNIERMLQTGKYIPYKAICESNARVEQFVTLAQDELRRTYPDQSTPFTKFQLDYTLCKMCNYEMNPDRTVHRMLAKTNRKGHY